VLSRGFKGASVVWLVAGWVEEWWSVLRVQWIQYMMAWRCYNRKRIARGKDKGCLGVPVPDFRTGKVNSRVEKEVLKRAFFDRDAITVARELLGKEIVVRGEGYEFSGIITETEAYTGVEDKASHAFGGKMTSRNSIMYGRPGMVYVYLIYGMYHLINIIARGEGVPEAVLIRSIEPRTGIPAMAERRYHKGLDELTKKEFQNLTTGPGKLTKAMGITMAENGQSLYFPEEEIEGEAVDAVGGTGAGTGEGMPATLPEKGQRILIREAEESSFEITETVRVGVDYAGEYALKPWRFYITGSRFISKY
jgi:DNA-3-methyladenine glycosylase